MSLPLRALAERLIAGEPGAAAVLADAARERLDVAIDPAAPVAATTMALLDALPDAPRRAVACALWVEAFGVYAPITGTDEMRALIGLHERDAPAEELAAAWSSARLSFRWPDAPDAIPYAMRMAVLRAMATLMNPRPTSALAEHAAVALAELTAFHREPDRFSDAFPAAREAGFARLLRLLADTLDDS